VIPTARAARLTMDREGIRRLAAETLGLPTSPYRFVDTEAEYRAAVAAIGLPCVVKPVMSSSGKGQSTLRSEADIARPGTTRRPVAAPVPAAASSKASSISITRSPC
jgi:phosphoribosylglycinamide formyltransferase 2